MSDNKDVQLKVRVFEFGTEDVADVLIRVVDKKNVVAMFRSNPITVSLPPGSYAVYISGDKYDTALRAFNLLPERDLALELPIYPVGAMPAPPVSIQDLPVRREGIDTEGVINALDVKLDRSAISEEIFDGPAFVDYRNPDGFIFTTKLNLETEPTYKVAFGTVPIHYLAHCGNNTWREMGSPK